MLLIPGILASKFVPQGDFESIATVVVGSGGAATVSFTSIPSTYQHLQLRAIHKTTQTGTLEFVRYRFNGVTASGNYRTHFLEGTGSVAQSSVYGETDRGMLYQPAASFGSNSFGTTILDILDYSNTNKLKTIRILNGCDNNSAGRIYFQSSWFNSTSVISSLEFAPQTSGNIAEYSHFALYGIKG